jgi:lipopolysaccharide transport system ATP-binding protein
MYLRLAFSVAAHLETEILVVDEVLAVGDAAFQKRCLGKMGTVAQGGRTVLFVSHNLAAVRGLCSRCLLLDSGALTHDATPDAAIDAYLSSLQTAGTGEADIASKPRAAKVDQTLRIEWLRLVTSAPPFVRSSAPLEVDIRFHVTEEVAGVVLGLAVETLDGTVVFEVRSAGSLGVLSQLVPGSYQTRCEIPGHRLLPGHYALSVGARSDRKHLDYVRQVLVFEVQAAEAQESAWYDDTGGLVQIRSRWDKPVPRDQEPT